MNQSAPRRPFPQPGLQQRRRQLNNHQHHYFGRRFRRIRPTRQNTFSNNNSNNSPMGELDKYVMHNLLVKIHPFRKIIWTLCALSILLGILIVLNSIWSLIPENRAANRIGNDTPFLIFSEALASALLILSVLGIKITFMANKAVRSEGPFSQRINLRDNELPSVELALAQFDSQRRPYSAPNWFNSSDWQDFFAAPGMVQQQEYLNGGRNLPPFDPFLFPPAPPRYSSLEVPNQAIMVSGRPRLAIAVSRRPSLPPVGQSNQTSSFVRSPPPPYVPTAA
uniref:Uncharacterized protein n=2 Tax=Meloidogyne TaxID=189290 RepID=A0A915NW59_9BILA